MQMEILCKQLDIEVYKTNEERARDNAHLGNHQQEDGILSNQTR